LNSTDELRLFNKVLAARKVVSGAVLARIEAAVVRPLAPLADRAAGWPNIARRRRSGCRS